MLLQMGSLLNTQYDGQYVFGGARTSTAPVDLSSFASGDRLDDDGRHQLLQG